MTTDVDVWAEESAGPAMPAADDAERTLAASVMARHDLVDELAAEFDPADFANDQLRWIWFAVEELRVRAAAGDIPYEAVYRQLRAFQADGRMPVSPMPLEALRRLYDAARPGSASFFAADVTRAAIARRICGLGATAGIRGRSPAFDPDADVAALQAELDRIVRPSSTANAATIADLLPAVLERAVTPPDRSQRVPTGFLDLDALFCGGFTGGQLVVVAARPAMGKSTLATGFARAAAITNGIPTFFSSLEMSKEDLAAGILCAEARVALHHHKQGIVDDAGLSRAATASARIVPAPLVIDDTADLSLPALRAEIRLRVRTTGLRVVIVDYLQLMRAPRAESRQAAVAMLSRGLKLLAKEFNVVMIVLAQLNRGPEQRTDKTPMVSDLRESGAIEQDADIVILLHREDAYNKESPRAGEADVIIGKHRGGPTGTVTVAFQGHYARFVDMAQT